VAITTPANLLRHKNMQRRLIENHPPSPPQSTDGDFASDASQFGDMYPLYGTPEPYAGAGQGHDESFNEQSSVTIVSAWAARISYMLYNELTRLVEHAICPDG
jgi:hypothetical protein